MELTLTAIHWVYLLLIGVIVAFMAMRRDTTVVCVLGIGIIGLLASGTLSGAVSGTFNSLIYAIKELSGTILIISIIVAMSRLLMETGVNEVMIRPFTGLIRSQGMAFWGIGLIMMVVSFFFWPSPAVALIGAVLLPVALRVGLPALGAAMAMNLFGHGIALSGDYIIQGAPKLTADAAGLPVSQVMEASVPLVIVMGVVTTVTAYWFMRRDQKSGAWRDGLVGSGSAGSIFGSDAHDRPSPQSAGLGIGAKRALAVLIPLLFAADVAVMFALKLQGGDATALIGGTAALITVVLSMLAHRGAGLEKSTAYIVDGFLFGFKVFGPVIPIAAFFYLGDSALPSLFGEAALPAGSHGIVNDLGVALAHAVPVNGTVAAVTLTAAGAITGLDGSGFSGISLAGSIAHLFGTAIGSGTDTLTALGQIAAIWVGGGTLVPWALIPAAAICGVSPFELARRNLKPVLIGLAVTTVAAIFLL
ncbi:MULTISPECIES: hypothetical protein [Paenibacillus]|uniref:hypothetical protein n=1 Tax=Paenibacillus TaxID=44249 RepID=UPI0009558B37|nr:MULTISPECIES: hypothetical protein [Paenibacillus]ASS65593.1 hypothetical protein CIC07_05190 [Paenibacillus sp. RUD330]SIQ30562.1 hypothetical protein SAMN05880555_1324 [Paenibacillus sp. RU4X]SIQ52372.1 hypothetical protein SAMN05880570_1323 [Paenibacillus sp. RU4T]